ncbi:hypothetical protein Bca52824_018039 [Brassica carinata]|uniref:RNase H type-1 domain-containing protein n=1 Tax=Brassica carinata TaxID=52824 RepID=A0A8X8AY13_BRACI|nr:hypothetical protein Bca52824_018039 [Brassica carinata]
MAQATSVSSKKKPVIPRGNLNPEFVCRSDAAWKKELNAAGLGWRFSDNRLGKFISHSETLACVNSSLVAEGLAIRAAIEDAIDLQLGNVVFESDSLQLVAAIFEGSDIVELHGILADISILATSFDSISFRFVNRSLLPFEDGLAKQALRSLVTNPT